MKTILIVTVFSLGFFANAKAAFVAYFVGSNGTTYNISDPTYFVFTTTGWNSGGGQTAAWGALRTSPSAGQPDSLNIAFATPNGQNLTVGLYQNVISYGISNFSQYRMDISGGPIPLNTSLTGWLDVKEIEFDASGKVNKAAFDWNMSSNPGTMRFNSTLALSPIPEPSMFTMFALVGGLALIRRRK